MVTLGTAGHAGLGSVRSVGCRWRGGLGTVALGTSTLGGLGGGGQGYARQATRGAGGVVRSGLAGTARHGKAGRDEAGNARLGCAPSGLARRERRVPTRWASFLMAGVARLDGVSFGTARQARRVSATQRAAWRARRGVARPRLSGGAGHAWKRETRQGMAGRRANKRPKEVSWSRSGMLSEPRCWRG